MIQVTPTFCYAMGENATLYHQNEFWVLFFRNALECAKYRKKFRTKGFSIFFEAF